MQMLSEDDVNLRELSDDPPYSRGVFINLKSPQSPEAGASPGSS